jgi:hypothetical protein
MSDDEETGEVQHITPKEGNSHPNKISPVVAVYIRTCIHDPSSNRAAGITPADMHPRHAHHQELVLSRWGWRRRRWTREKR